MLVRDLCFRDRFSHKDEAEQECSKIYMHSREWHVYAQAVIVRIMKQRRRLSHEALLLEVSVHLHVCARVRMCPCVRVRVW